METLARAHAATAEPYVGVTTDGTVVPGLFSLQRSGVPTKPLKDAADAYLAALDATQRSTTSFGLQDTAWSLSVREFELACDIMRLNETLAEITGSWDEYGEWLYWLSIFGTPSVDQPWGWQSTGII